MFRPETKEELQALIFEEKVNLSEIDTSLITDMSDLFLGGDFNKLEGSIENWDVSSVTDRKEMFCNAKNFNQDISKWDVSKVRDMSYMFYDATAFNQDIGGWDVGRVKNMFAMFGQAISFNQDLSRWDMSQVKGKSAKWIMFDGRGDMSKLSECYQE